MKLRAFTGVGPYASRAIMMQLEWFMQRMTRPGKGATDRQKRRLTTARYVLRMGFIASALLILLCCVERVGATDELPAFEIQSFIVEGNTLFSEKAVKDILEPFRGPGRTSQDVESARGALEKSYHDKGYPAVLVNIPEQTVEKGIIRLEVIESTIGMVRITGNRWFTRKKILEDLPSLAPGKVIFLPDVQKDLERIGRNDDLKVSPALTPGKEPGHTDVDIKVDDHPPLHGSLELNNRSTHDTTDLRLNATLHYDNLWQKGHSISAQYQTSPEDTSEVKLYALSYTLPAPWLIDHQIALFAIRSESNTITSAESLLVNGKGTILGLRYVVPLEPYKTYTHNITLGLDYKDFAETTALSGADQGAEIKPTTYLPLSFIYSSYLVDSWGGTRFSGGLNVAFRGFVTDAQQFENQRANARGNYMYMTAGAEREQKLPGGLSLFLKLDGQLSDQPLISTEQYFAGGMTNVRGYKEGEASGDDALHSTVELHGPDIGLKLNLKDRFEFIPFVFYDYAWLNVKDALPGQDEVVRLGGVGAGARGNLHKKNLFYEVALAFPVKDTDKTDKYQSRIHFKVGAQF
ncbi:MAG TPA: ShlB/FhaC/HecB family hemolysin secretion/activation protein [Syntrophorhabdaceae bacterium]|nr:ShlB/FhaC/HecB family hemolysin secretion/activation protein [Syntrophorhabdaceae bacterium]